MPAMNFAVANFSRDPQANKAFSMIACQLVAYMILIKAFFLNNAVAMPHLNAPQYSNPQTPGYH